MPGGSRYQQGNEIFDQMLYLPSVPVPNVAANATANQTFTIPGVLVGDLIGWNQQGTIAGLSVDNIFVSASNVVTFFWSNATVGAINGSANQAFVISVCRAENANLGLTQLPTAIV